LMMRETKYIRQVLITALALVALIAAVNYIVNPLGVYGTPVIKGFNDSTPAATAYARLKKREDIKRIKPDILITGSSRADIAFDPRPELFGKNRAYNAGLPASSIREQRMMLEFAAAVHPLKTAIITLDFFSFNAKRPENKQFNPKSLAPETLNIPRTFFETYGTLVSLDTLIASHKHLRYIKQLDRRAQILPNGRKTNADTAHEINQRGAHHLFTNPPNAAEITSDDFSFSYSGAPGDTTFRHLDAMLNLARQRNIDVILLIPPVHESFLVAQDKAGMTNAVKEWKKRLAATVTANAAHYNAQPYPLWDFAYKNAYTAEPVPAEGDTKSRMQWFWDSNHAKPELGDIILRHVLKHPEAPTSFGIRLL
ncbi:MAG: hypothetical protein OXT65_00090, partial [Alphaproteobacteria bacterium]|nr:hypothetical protein [Alphaproteobacteria bacterium]